MQDVDSDNDNDDEDTKRATSQHEEFLTAWISWFIKKDQGVGFSNPTKWRWRNQWMEMRGNVPQSNISRERAETSTTKR